MNYNTNSTIVWEGISKLDNKTPIILIATGLNFSTNSKTGNMIQTYIIRRDMVPSQAFKLGKDFPICGNCPFKSGNCCYVNVGQAANKVYTTYKSGHYQIINRTILQRFENRNLRIGTYGDPAAVPYIIWYNLLKRVKGFTGYTHQWRNLSDKWKFLMASTEDPIGKIEAQINGWRTFNVISEHQDLDGEIFCPASPEGGNKTKCDTCRLCMGNKSNAKSINIVAHGLNHKVQKVTRVIEQLIEI